MSLHHSPICVTHPKNNKININNVAAHILLTDSQEWNKIMSEMSDETTVNYLPITAKSLAIAACLEEIIITSNEFL